jgi:hypothetical protein
VFFGRTHYVFDLAAAAGIGGNSLRAVSVLAGIADAVLRGGIGREAGAVQRVADFALRQR